MHIIQKLKVGIDIPREYSLFTEENKDGFKENVKKVTAESLGLRPQDTQEVIIEE